MSSGRVVLGSVIVVLLLVVIPALVSDSVGPSVSTRVSASGEARSTFAIAHGPSVTGSNHTLTKSRAGYTFAGAVGSFIGAWVAQWKVPRFAGNCSSSAPTEIAYFGVGESENLTGAYLTAQVGTAVECSAGRVSYFVWYQFGSHPVRRAPLAFSPMDVVQGYVVSNASQVILVDKSTGAWTNYITGPTQSTAPRLAAILVERPSNGGTPAPLPDFGSVLFENNSPIGSGGLPNATAYDMTTGGTAGLLTHTGSLLTGLGGFRVDWI